MIRDELPVTVGFGGVAWADFAGDDSPQRYDLLLVATQRRAFADPAVRRLEISVSALDRPRRRALHRAGFRLEAVRRARWIGPSGDPEDEAGYALLREDRSAGPEGFSAVMNSVTPRKRAISHVLLTDEAGRVCTLETSFKREWELPGGILNPGESPRAGAIREVREELGYRISVGRLLVVDWLVPYLGWEDALELVFDAGTLNPRSAAMLRPDLQEIRAVHWLEPEASMAAMAPYARGRVAAALEARAAGRTAYLEAGAVIS
ncbi:MAG: NUDIX hydrolase [Propionicimonas sp.]|nr:NUDIX hydrolase [Propionicimonas sp.]